MTISVYLLFIFIVTELILRLMGMVYSRIPHLEKFSNDSCDIICLGDSFTYGTGVDYEYSYPKQLERMLNEKKIISRKFRVFNLGIPGYNSSQVLKYLRYILDKYGRPDLIMVLTGANDSWNFTDSNIYRFIGKDKFISKLLIHIEMLITKLRIYKMIKIIKLNLEGKSAPHMDSFRAIAQKGGVNINTLKKLFEYNLTEMVNVARENNVPIILQNYPRGDLYGEEITKKVAEKLSVPFIDNYSLFSKNLKYFSYKDLFLYDNSHPNKFGYKIMVENIYKKIKEIIR